MSNGECEVNEVKPGESGYMNELNEKTMAMMNVNALDQETI